MSVYRSALLELEHPEEDIDEYNVSCTKNQLQNILDYGSPAVTSLPPPSNVTTLCQLKREDDRIYDILHEYNAEIDTIRQQYKSMLDDAKDYHSDIDKKALLNLISSFDELSLEVKTKLPEVSSIKDSLTLFSQSLDTFVSNYELRWNKQEELNGAISVKFHEISEAGKGLFNLNKALITSLGSSYSQLLSDFKLLSTESHESASAISGLRDRMDKIEQSSFMLTNKDEITEIASVASRVREEVAELRDSLSVVTTFKTNLNQMRSEFKQRIARRDRLINLYRDLLYMTSFTSNIYLHNIFRITSPIDVGPNVMDVHTHYRSMAFIFEMGTEFGTHSCAFNHQGAPFLKVLQDGDGLITIDFPYAKDQNLVCDKSCWKNDSIPLLIITVDSHDTEFSTSAPATVWISAHIMDGLRDTKDSITPTTIKKSVKLTLPVNYHTGKINISSTNTDFQPYFIRMISSIISPECCADAALHHIARVRLNDMILTSHTFDEIETNDNPFLDLSHDVEMLKRTTVRSKFGHVFFNTNDSHDEKSFIPLSFTPAFNGTDSKIPLSFTYAKTVDDRLGPQRMWSSVLRLMTIPNSANAVSPIYLKYDGESTPAMTGIMSCELSISISDKTAKAWWSTNPSGGSAANDVHPEFNRFRPECGQANTSVHTMLFHIRTHQWALGYELNPDSSNELHSITALLRIPVTSALPSVAIAQATSPVSFTSQGDVVFSGSVSWQAVNVVKDGSQSMELRGQLNLTAAATASGKKFIILAGKVENKGWSSIQAIVKSYGIPQSSSTLKLTNGGVKFTSTPISEGRCMTWNNNIVSINVNNSFNITESDPLVTNHPDYQNAIIVSSSGLTYKGKPLFMRLDKGSLRCGFLQDPIGLGNVTLIDYEKIKLAEQVQGLAVSVLNVQQAVNDQDKRIAIIEKMFEAQPATTLQNVFNTILSVGSVIAPYLGALANIAFHLLAVNVRIAELLSAGVNHSSLSQIIYEMYLTVSVIRLIRNDNSQLANVNKRIYDITRTASSEITKRLVTFKAIREAEKADKQGKVKLPSGTKITITPSHQESIANDVEHIVRPLESMKLAGSHFKTLAEKVQAGTASTSENLLFHKLRDVHLLPMHNYLKMTSYEGGAKHINVLGVSDGYAANYGGKQTTHLLGNNKFQALKMKADGAGGLGVWKMRLEKNENEWTLSDPRKSGMTDYEILCAVGISHNNATEIITKSPKTTVDKLVKWSYEEKSKEYLLADKHYSVKQKQVLMMPGQFEAIHNAIRASSGAYNYTLVRNNCQKFTDDILKMISNTAYRPKWMSTGVHNSYVHNLENILTSSEA